MNVVYLSDDDGTAAVPLVPLKVVGYECGVFEINAKIMSHKAYKRSDNYLRKK